MILYLSSINEITINITQRSLYENVQGNLFEINSNLFAGGEIKNHAI